ESYIVAAGTSTSIIPLTTATTATLTIKTDGGYLSVFSNGYTEIPRPASQLTRLDNQYSSTSMARYNSLQTLLVQFSMRYHSLTTSTSPFTHSFADHLPSPPPSAYDSIYEYAPSSSTPWPCSEAPYHQVSRQLTHHPIPCHRRRSP